MNATTFAQVLGRMIDELPPAPAPSIASAPTAADVQRWVEVVVDALPRAATVARRPDWAIELDVELPCDPAAVRRAFRRRALATHPDRPGGSHDAFLCTLRALDEGLLALR